jgi:hypothetical protein
MWKVFTDRIRPERDDDEGWWHIVPGDGQSKISSTLQGNGARASFDILVLELK